MTAPAAPAIRRATAADGGDIARLSRREIEAGLAWGWTPPRVWEAIHDPATNVVVADDARGVLIGFGIMRYLDAHAHLALLAVHPRHRRRGLATALLAWLEAPARAAGLGHVTLEARRDNATALAFYEALGYRRAGVVSGMYQGVCDGVRLRKPLAITPPTATAP